MTRLAKTLQEILQGSSDVRIRFAALRRVLKALGFEERIRGDHHIFTREDVAEIINLQPKGSFAKAYQVKQVRQLILRCRLGGAL